ncbi:MAG TPA: hypothetical protein VNK95_10750, partial [Caldilineaceae bacterium]|nr:hypothetical protein [Caldilineaceae bacterium]
MQTVVRSPFTAVKTEGGLLPMDVLQRIAEGEGLPGLQPEDYHLSGERLNEAISRSWPRCQKAWRVFVEQREKQPESAVTLTRERWLLVLFDVLGYGRLPAVRSVEVDGVSYPISHLWERVPFLLAGYDQELDRRAEGRTRRSPHSLMQELLNRSPDYRWGLISNGLRLRLLRDNASLSRAAYVEFDLEAIMEGELYAEFSLLWLVCHQSRVEAIGRAAGDAVVVGDEGDAEDGGDDADDAKSAGAAPIATGYDCWLERWSQLAAEQGARALDALRQGVEQAIEALGSGFLTHPANSALRACLRAGELGAQAYYQQVRRLVYRLLFLFVAEDRDLLLLPGSDAVTRARYHDFYSLARIRRLAEVSRGGRHPDLYRQLRRLFVLLRSGYPPLGLPSLGSYLFSDRATPDLDGAELANQDLLAAIRALGFTVENHVRRPVDYRNLDTEELGSVYESLLELHPQLTVETGEFRLLAAAGSERKTTGSYYTPTALVNELLNSALEPVAADRLAQAEAEWRKGADRSPERRRQLAERALLRIKVLDYAAGSGHMLIGAARRLARHLARIRSGDEEPGPAAVRAALRDVVRYCLYGVDANETSVELCKVALWMESLEPGKPLGFLDAHIRPGNSLIGVLALETLADGIPDDAYAAKTGDDRAAAGALKKRNRRERESLTATLFEVGEGDGLLAEWRAFLAEPEETPEQVAAKEAHYAALRADPRWAKLQMACHLWTAPFFAEYTGDKQRDQRIPTTADLRAYLANPAKADPAMAAYAEALARRHNF